MLPSFWPLKSPSLIILLKFANGAIFRSCFSVFFVPPPVRSVSFVYFKYIKVWWGCNYLPFETSKFFLYFSGTCIPTNESLIILLAVYLHWYRQFNNNNYYLFKKFLVSDWLTANCEIVISTQWRTKSGFFTFILAKWRQRVNMKNFWTRLRHITMTTRIILTR